MGKDVLILTSKFRGRADVAAEFLEQRGCRLVEREVVYPVTEDHLCELVRDVDGLITGLEPITARVLSHANRLKVISAAGVGFDHIDVEEATRRGIAVCNCHGCNNHSVAELAFGMMIGLSRSIYTLDRQIRNGGWAPSPSVRSCGTRPSASSDSAGSGEAPRCLAAPSACACSPPTSSGT